ncbi:MAG TPA: Ohr family peroxiredoxin [Rhizomicrobium sp.]
MSIDVKYRTSATTTGGRDGRVRSEDGHLQAQLSTPKELGGAGGEGTNPEQLFAAGYSACFLSALKFAGHQMLQLPQDVSVRAPVGVGLRKEGGYGLAADLVIDMPRTRLALTRTRPATTSTSQ